MFNINHIMDRTLSNVKNYLKISVVLALLFLSTNIDVMSNSKDRFTSKNNICADIFLLIFHSVFLH